jgi:hypothetical protein
VNSVLVSQASYVHPSGLLFYFPERLWPHLPIPFNSEILRTGDSGKFLLATKPVETRSRPPVTCGTLANVARVFIQPEERKVWYPWLHISKRSCVAKGKTSEWRTIFHESKFDGVPLAESMSKREFRDAKRNLREKFRISNGAENLRQLMIFSNRYRVPPNPVDEFALQLTKIKRVEKVVIRRIENGVIRRVLERVKKTEEIEQKKLEQAAKKLAQDDKLLRSFRGFVLIDGEFIDGEPLRKRRQDVCIQGVPNQPTEFFVPQDYNEARGCQPPAHVKNAEHYQMFVGIPSLKKKSSAKKEENRRRIAKSKRAARAERKSLFDKNNALLREKYREFFERDSSGAIPPDLRARCSRCGADFFRKNKCFDCLLPQKGLSAAPVGVLTMDNQGETPIGKRYIEPNRHRLSTREFLASITIQRRWKRAYGRGRQRIFNELLYLVDGQSTADLRRGGCVDSGAVERAAQRTWAAIRDYLAAGNPMPEKTADEVLFAKEADELKQFARAHENAG